MKRLIEGDGTAKHPYIMQGHRNEPGNLEKMLEIAEREGYTRLSVAYSGRYYERRDNGWWETTNTETCDKFHGLPATGKKYQAAR